MTQEESFEEFREDLLEDLDVLKLEPVGFSKTFVISGSMIILALVIIILFAIYQDPWLAILLVVAAGLSLMGTYLFISEIRRLSDDKNIYTFSHEGFKIEREDEIQRFITWKEIDDLKIKNRTSSNKRKLKCVISIKKEDIIFFLYAFNEVTSNIKNTQGIASEITNYYEKVRDN